MKLSPGFLGKALIALFLIAVVVYITIDRDSRSETSTGSTSSEAVTTTQNSAGTTRPNGGAPGRQISPSSNKNSGPTTALLATRASGFLNDYYLLKPDDTESSRRTRLAKYVLPADLPLLDVGISSGTEADNERIRLKLTQQGEIDPSQLHINPSSDSPNKQVLKARVVIITTGADGKQLSRIEFNTASIWQSKGDNWYLINFDKGGGDTG